FDISDETGEKSEQFEMSSEALKLPAKLAPTQRVELAPTAEGIVTFLKHHPKAKTVTLSAKFADMEVKPLTSKDGQPLKLELTFKVL
ncbi:MAG: hypothetical protein JWM80_3824, partial [Cyanobacteria bacterium RYN_339]|nr:hypothetical protein [Cyanobacteria bacterium RYN_339]